MLTDWLGRLADRVWLFRSVLGAWKQFTHSTISPAHEVCFILFWGRAKVCSTFFISYVPQFVPENINNDLSLVTPDAVVIMVFEALFRRKQLWQVQQTEPGLNGVF